MEFINIWIAPIFSTVIGGLFLYFFVEVLMKPKADKMNKIPVLKILIIIFGILGLAYIATDDIKSKLSLKSKNIEIGKKTNEIKELSKSNIQIKDSLEKEIVKIKSIKISKRQSIDTPPVQIGGNNNVYTQNQSGGTNIGSLNVGKRQRIMGEIVKKAIIDSIPLQVPVKILSVAGDAEGYVFANEIKSWMKNKGYSNVGGVTECTSYPAMKELQCFKNKDGIWEICVGLSINQ